MTDTIDFLNFINFFLLLLFSLTFFFPAAYIRDTGFSIFYNFLFSSLGQRIAFGGYRTRENSRPDTSFSVILLLYEVVRSFMIP